MTALSGRPHGNAKYHLEKCRCPVCCKAARDYDNNRRRAIAYGRWQPFVPAEPVRQHVRALSEFGIGWMRLARLAGVPRGSMSKLLYGDPQRGMVPSKRILPKNAAKILGVEPVLEHLGDAVSIDGTGTRRRLQALAAAGWPHRQLAVRLAVNPANFRPIIHGQPSQLVKVGTLRAVTALYDQLWNVDPLQQGVRRDFYDRARGQARAAGWAPVGAWDDDQIDDPEAWPDWTGHCGTPQGRRIHYRIRIPVCQPCRTAAQQQTAA